jgi:hypothetical protein
MPRIRAVSARTKAACVSARPRGSRRPPSIQSRSRLAIYETSKASVTPTRAGTRYSTLAALKARLMLASKQSNSPRCGATSRRTAPGCSHGRGSSTGHGPASCLGGIKVLATIPTEDSGG